jgi:hypothetical protein
MSPFHFGNFYYYISSDRENVKNLSSAGILVAGKAIFLRYCLNSVLVFGKLVISSWKMANPTGEVNCKWLP